MGIVRRCRCRCCVIPSRGSHLNETFNASQATQWSKEVGVETCLHSLDSWNKKMYNITTTEREKEKKEFSDSDEWAAGEDDEIHFPCHTRRWWRRQRGEHKKWPCICLLCLSMPTTFNLTRSKVLSFHASCCRSFSPVPFSPNNNNTKRPEVVEDWKKCVIKTQLNELNLTHRNGRGAKTKR